MRVFCFLLLFFFFVEAGAESFVRSMVLHNSGSLFEVRKGDGFVGWIYGSMHIGKQDNPSIGRNVLDALDRANVIFYESDDGDFDDEGSEADHKDIVFNKKITERLLEGRKSSPKKIDDPVRILTQVAYVGVAARPLLRKYKGCGYFLEFGSETLVKYYLMGRQVEIGMLETPFQAKMAIMNEIKNFNIISGGGSSEDKKVSDAGDLCAELERSGEKWASGYDFSEGSKVECDANTVFCRSNKVRNRNMAETIYTASKNGKTNFFLLGASHLWGSDGVLNILKNNGFTLDRVISPENNRPQQ